MTEEGGGGGAGMFTFDTDIEDVKRRILEGVQGIKGDLESVELPDIGNFAEASNSVTNMGNVLRELPTSFQAMDTALVGVRDTAASIVTSIETAVRSIQTLQTEGGRLPELFRQPSQGHGSPVPQPSQAPPPAVPQAAPTGLPPLPASTAATHAATPAPVPVVAPAPAAPAPASQGPLSAVEQFVRTQANILQQRQLQGLGSHDLAEVHRQAADNARVIAQSAGRATPNAHEQSMGYQQLIRQLTETMRAESANRVPLNERTVGRADIDLVRRAVGEFGVFSSMTGQGHPLSGIHGAIAVEGSLPIKTGGQVITDPVRDYLLRDADAKKQANEAEVRRQAENWRRQATYFPGTITPVPGGYGNTLAGGFLSGRQARNVLGEQAYSGFAGQIRGGVADQRAAEAAERAERRRQERQTQRARDDADREAQEEQQAREHRRARAAGELQPLGRGYFYNRVSDDYQHESGRKLGGFEQLHAEDLKTKRDADDAKPWYRRVSEGFQGQLFGTHGQNPGEMSMADRLAGMAGAAGMAMKYGTVYRIGGEIQRAASEGTKYVMEFQQGLVELSSAMEDVKGPSAGLLDNLQDISRTTGTDLIDSLKTATMAFRAFGQDAVESFTQATATMQVLGLSPQVARTVEMSAGNAYGKQALGNTPNVLFQAQRQFGVSQDQFAPALPQLYAMGAVGGFSQRQITQLAASQTQALGPGGVAGTQKLLDMASSTAGRAQFSGLNMMLRSSGMGGIDVNGSGAHMWEQAGDAYAKMSPTMQRQFVASWGRNLGPAAASTMKSLEPGGELRKAWDNPSEGADKTAGSEAAKLLNTVEGEIKKIVTDFQSIAASLGRSGVLNIFGVVVKAIEMTIGAVAKIAQALSWLSQEAKGIPGMLIGLVAALKVIGSLRSGLARNVLTNVGSRVGDKVGEYTQAPANKKKAESEVSETEATRGATVANEQKTKSEVEQTEATRGATVANEQKAQSEVEGANLIHNVVVAEQEAYKVKQEMIAAAEGEVKVTEETTVAANGLRASLLELVAGLRQTAVAAATLRGAELKEGASKVESGAMGAAGAGARGAGSFLTSPLGMGAMVGLFAGYTAIQNAKEMLTATGKTMDLAGQSTAGLQTSDDLKSAAADLRSSAAETRATSGGPIKTIENAFLGNPTGRAADVAEAQAQADDEAAQRQQAVRDRYLRTDTLHSLDTSTTEGLDASFQALQDSGASAQSQVVALSNALKEATTSLGGTTHAFTQFQLDMAEATLPADVQNAVSGVQTTAAAENGVGNFEQGAANAGIFAIPVIGEIAQGVSYATTGQSVAANLGIGEHGAGPKGSSNFSSADEDVLRDADHGKLNDAVGKVITAEMKKKGNKWDDSDTIAQVFNAVKAEVPGLSDAAAQTIAVQSTGNVRTRLDQTGDSKNIEAMKVLTDAVNKLNTVLPQAAGAEALRHAWRVPTVGGNGDTSKDIVSGEAGIIARGGGSVGITSAALKLQGDKDTQRTLNDQLAEIKLQKPPGWEDTAKSLQDAIDSLTNTIISDTEALAQAKIGNIQATGALSLSTLSSGDTVARDQVQLNTLSQVMAAQHDPDQQMQTAAQIRELTQQKTRDEARSQGAYLISQADPRSAIQTATAQHQADVLALNAEKKLAGGQKLTPEEMKAHQLANEPQSIQEAFLNSATQGGTRFAQAAIDYLHGKGAAGGAPGGAPAGGAGTDGKPGADWSKNWKPGDTAVFNSAYHFGLEHPGETYNEENWKKYHPDQAFPGFGSTGPPPAASGSDGTVPTPGSVATPAPAPAPKPQQGNKAQFNGREVMFDNGRWSYTGSGEAAPISADQFPASPAPVPGGPKPQQGNKAQFNGREVMFDSGRWSYTGSGEAAPISPDAFPDSQPATQAEADAQSDFDRRSRNRHLSPKATAHAIAVAGPGDATFKDSKGNEISFATQKIVKPAPKPDDRTPADIQGLIVNPTDAAHQEGVAAATTKERASALAEQQARAADIGMLHEALTPVGDTAALAFAQAKTAMSQAQFVIDPGARAAQVRKAIELQVQGNQAKQQQQAAVLKAGIDPRDLVKNAEAEAIDIAGQLKVLPAGDIKGRADLQRRAAEQKIEIAKRKTEVTNAREEASVAPGDTLGEARAALDSARRNLANDQKGSAQYYQDLKTIRKDQQDKALAEASQSSALARLKIDPRDVVGNLKADWGDLLKQYQATDPGNKEGRAKIYRQMQQKVVDVNRAEVSRQNAMESAFVRPGNEVDAARAQVDAANRALKTEKVGEEAWWAAVKQRREGMQQYALASVAQAAAVARLRIDPRDVVGNLQQDVRDLQAQYAATDPGNIKGRADIARQIQQKNVDTARANVAKQNAMESAFVRPGNEVDAARAQIDAANRALRTEKVGEEAWWAAVKQRREGQQAYALAVAAQQSSALRLRIDPQDVVGNLREDLGDLQRQYNATDPGNITGRNTIRRQMQQKQIEIRRAQAATASAQEEASVFPGSQLGEAKAAFDATLRNLMIDRRGTEQWFLDQKKLKEQQLQIVQAQEADAAEVAKLGIDLTNPVQTAIADYQAALKKLADLKKLHASPDVIHAQQNVVRQAGSAAEAAQFQQNLSDVQNANTLHQISHMQYLQYLEGQHNSLLAQMKGMKKTSEGYRQAYNELNSIDNLILEAKAGLQGQFNIGDIKLPTVYQVRRSILEQRNAAVADTIDQVIQSKGTFTNPAQQSNAVNQTVTINVNGADIAKVKAVLDTYFKNQMLATGTRTTAPRKV